MLQLGSVAIAALNSREAGAVDEQWREIVQNYECLERDEQHAAQTVEHLGELNPRFLRARFLFGIRDARLLRSLRWCS